MLEILQFSEYVLEIHHVCCYAGAVLTREWIGVQLRKARQPEKQETVASAIRSLGVPMTQNRLSRLERGETDMAPDEIAAFCLYFRVPHEYFLSEPEGSAALQVSETQGTYSRLISKLEGLSNGELEALERIVDELKKR
ncbi:MAG: helix-turn-helix transcriptional regulator [Chloroflexi bacterium]|nr:helix-turn-helix transcriptional regulator [Chloroflexota bacterium]